MRLFRLHHLPVRTIVVLLRETERPVPLPFRLRWGGRSTLVFDCDIVRLWELPQALVLDRPEPALWSLVTLMAGATPATVEGVAGRLARLPTLSEADRRDFVGLTVGLAGLRLPREAMRQVLRRDPMLRDILRDSSTVEIWLEEGRQEGRQEGQRELVRQALEDRFGAVEPEALAALATADAATLRALVVHPAGDTPAQVRRRLGLG